MDSLGRVTLKKKFFDKHIFVKVSQLNTGDYYNRNYNYVIEDLKGNILSCGHGCDTNLIGKIDIGYVHAIANNFSQ